MANMRSTSMIVLRSVAFWMLTSFAIVIFLHGLVGIFVWYSIGYFQGHSRSYKLEGSLGGVEVIYGYGSIVEFESDPHNLRGRSYSLQYAGFEQNTIFTLFRLVIDQARDKYFLPDRKDPFASTRVIIMMPESYFLVLTMIPSSIWIFFARDVVRLQLRLRRGFCIKCGYDLRASKDKCPECGTEIPKPAENVSRLKRKRG